ncbi:hypothetical protein HAX54_004165 [Datura stramonium]|uniref:Kinesin motor domain-containing protein n=1 Tax=Datura stramonium TaxID=4076 RepID=A0ABS8RVB4_DATST|nr:hypothetical protein [Datura stramonium]
MEEVEERIFVSVRLRPLNEDERNDVSDWECIDDTTIIYKNSSFSPSERLIIYLCTITTFGSLAVIAQQDRFMKKQLKKLLSFSCQKDSIRSHSSDNYSTRLLDDPERGTVIEKLTEEPLRDWNHLRRTDWGDFLGLKQAPDLTKSSDCESSAGEYLGSDFEYPFSYCGTKMNFVDLAGSERAYQSLSAGTRLKKAPSLGGNGRSAIICTISPARNHVEQSRNTLLGWQDWKSELRYPRACIFPSDYEALLQEKDHQIQQFGFGHYPNLRVKRSPDYQSPMQQISILRDTRYIDVDVRARSLGHSRCSSEDQFIHVPEFEETIFRNNTFPMY